MFKCWTNTIIESINVRDDARNLEIVENNSIEDTTTSPPTLTSNPIENDQDQEMKEEEQTSLVKKTTSTTKNHPITNINVCNISSTRQSMLSTCIFYCN